MADEKRNTRGVADEKRNTRRRGEATPLDAAAQVSRDLRARGVPAELARSLTQVLSPAYGRLDGGAYALLLDGARTLAESPQPAATAARDLGHIEREVAELERMMEGFQRELKKLHEALSVLDAYLRRMQSSGGEIVH